MKKPKKETKLDKIKDVIIYICVAAAVLLWAFSIVYWSYDIPKQVHNWSMRKAMGAYVGDSETQATIFYNEISDSKFAAVIGYNCSKKQFRETSCLNYYYIYFNKVGDKWVADESSRRVMW